MASQEGRCNWREKEENQAGAPEKKIFGQLERGKPGPNEENRHAHPGIWRIPLRNSSKDKDRNPLTFAACSRRTRHFKTLTFRKLLTGQEKLGGFAVDRGKEQRLRGFQGICLKVKKLAELRRGKKIN